MNQSLSEVMKNQSDYIITFDTQLKTTLFRFKLYHHEAETKVLRGSFFQNVRNVVLYRLDHK